FAACAPDPLGPCGAWPDGAIRDRRAVPTDPEQPYHPGSSSSAVELFPGGGLAYAIPSLCYDQSSIRIMSNIPATDRLPIRYRTASGSDRILKGASKNCGSSPWAISLLG